MALALGRAILSVGRVEASAIARAFDEWLLGSPVDVGDTVSRGIAHFRRTRKPHVRRSALAAGNGACMRALPVALATAGASQQEVADACRAQAHVTHHNELSDAASETVVSMVQASLAGAEKLELLHEHAHRLRARHPEFCFRTARQLEPSGYIVETMRATLARLNLGLVVRNLGLVVLTWVWSFWSFKTWVWSFMPHPAHLPRPPLTWRPRGCRLRADAST